MPLFARRPTGPLPLPAPRPDGTGWPDADAVGRPSFEAAAFHEIAVKNAYEIEAHAVADRLVDQLLPRLPAVGEAVDAPFLRKVVLTAARIGAGLGMVGRGLDDAPDEVDRRVAGALLLARRGLPDMPPAQAALVGYFLLAAFRVARRGPDEVDRLEADLG